jgi:hypothetical protein
MDFKWIVVHSCFKSILKLLYEVISSVLLVVLVNLIWMSNPNRFFVIIHSEMNLNTSFFISGISMPLWQLSLYQVVSQRFCLMANVGFLLTFQFIKVLNSLLGIQCLLILILCLNSFLEEARSVSGEPCLGLFSCYLRGAQ